VKRAVVIGAVAAAAALGAGLVVWLSPDKSTETEPRADGRPPFARDGVVLFTRHSPGPDPYLPNAALYSSTAAGTQIRRLTKTSGQIDNIAVSPDGQKIAYSAETYEYGDHRHVTGDHVHVMNANGSGDRSIYSCPVSYCGSLQWSPVGQRLLVNGRTLLDLDGHVSDICDSPCRGGNRLGGAIWSPDPSRVAFVTSITLHLGDGTATVPAIATARSDASEIKVVTNQQCTKAAQSGCTYDSSPVWSPDGKWIAFARLEPTSLRLDGSRGFGPVGPTGVFVMRADGSAISQLHSCGLNGGPSMLQWSPTGDRLAFVCTADAFRNETMPSTIGVADMASRRVGTVAVKTRTSQANEDSLRPVISWAPSGTALAVVAPLVGNPNSLYVVRVNQTRLTAPDLVRRDVYAPVVWSALQSGT
jgi:Tol biopolymer transport system component